MDKKQIINIIENVALTANKNQSISLFAGEVADRTLENIAFELLTDFEKAKLKKAVFLMVLFGKYN